MTSQHLSATIPPRPRSAVSSGVGFAGLAGIAVWTVIAFSYGLTEPGWALVNVLACGVPMVLWSLIVDKVHRNPTTGLDWDAPSRAVRDTLDISLTKLAGLWATWAIIAGLYCIFRFYWRDNYLFAMELFTFGAIPLFFISIPYVIWLDTRLKEPRDGAWHFGALLMGVDGWDKDAILHHLRAWAVKGFFLAFMISIVPGGYAHFIGTDFKEVFRNPVALAQWLITMMFMLDVAFATVGYLLTLKPLDAHIRSANPYMQGWVAALMCYPPFILMGSGSPLDYHAGAGDWVIWLQDWPWVQAAIGFVMVGLTGVYAWATIAFGLRFSNLTDRGILTHGPYALTKHPAYVSKNLFWWIETLPFLAVSGSTIDAIRNTAILALVSGIYFWRAKTEERHLSADSTYVAYASWMAQHSAMARFLRWLSKFVPQRKTVGSAGSVSSISPPPSC